MPFNDNLPAENTNPWYSPLVTAWNNLKTFVNGLETALGGKADTVHTHAAGDVTSGTFTQTRIPDLNASKITSGTLDVAQIPDIPSTKVTGLGTAATTNSTAYATAAQGAKADTAVQPAGLTKAAVGLPNVDNTSDANKPISTATQTALNARVEAEDPAKFWGVFTSAEAPTPPNDGRVHFGFMVP